MWANIWMSLTNIYAGRAVFAYWQNAQYLPAFIVAGAGLSSAIYHLIECEKHQMTGIGLTNQSKYHYQLLNLDRMFATLTGLTMLLQAHQSNWLLVKDNLCLGITAVYWMTASEISFRYQKWPYIILHTGWHLMAFHLAYRFAVFQ